MNIICRHSKNMLHRFLLLDPKFFRKGTSAGSHILLGQR